MASSNTLCAICAWKATCQKKFSMSGRDMKCADFVKDVSTTPDKEGPEEGESEKKE